MAKMKTWKEVKEEIESALKEASFGDADSVRVDCIDIMYSSGDVHIDRNADGSVDIWS